MSESQIVPLRDLVIESLSSPKVREVMDLQSLSFVRGEVQVTKANEVDLCSREVPLLLSLTKAREEGVMVSSPTMSAAKMALNNEDREVMRIGERDGLETMVMMVLR
jgi:hypothetical protein